MPPLFGSSERTQILAILWLTGPITVRKLARARHVDSAGTFRTVARLIRVGFVVKSTRGRRYIGLNFAHPVRHALGMLLSPLVRKYGLNFPRLSQRRETLPAKYGQISEKAVEDFAFGSPVRSQLILLLNAVGSADARQLCRLLGQNYLSVIYALQALENDLMLRSQRVGTRRVYALSDSYPAGIEYRRLVGAVVRALPRYRALAESVDAVTMRYR